MTVDNSSQNTVTDHAEFAFIPPGKGTTFWVVGDLVTLKATSAQTHGAFTQIETTVLPQAGPPPHVHTNQDEWFTILEGELQFEINGQAVSATAGTCLCGPRGIPHTFKNVSEKPAKMLVTITPGGIEAFFEEVGIRITDPADIPPEVTGAHIGSLLTIAPKHGINILPPPPPV